MSRNPSACIPPPSDYTPRSRPTQSIRSRGRGRGGCDRNSARRGGGHHYNHQTISFHKDDKEEQTKYQPGDKFYRNDDDDYFAKIQDDDGEKDEEDEVLDHRSNDPDDVDDPLDAYMKSLESEQGTELKSRSSSQDHSPKGQSDEIEISRLAIPETDKKGVRLDIDNTDDVEESYYKYVEKIKSKKPEELEYGETEERQNTVEYDSDGNIMSVRRNKRDIEPLPPIDHSAIDYKAFKKIFYQEHEDIKRLSSEQESDLRAKLEIKVSGDSPPRPVCSFAHFKFEEPLMRVIRRSEYTQPTPIQAQAIPAALLGRNIIGIAMTGSGKTAAYVWPMIVHIIGQHHSLRSRDGPSALILVPTRELALQVYGEAKRFSNSYKLSIVCAYGGGSKYEQSRDLELGADIIVATPGRLIDLIKLGVTNLKQITYLVLDEADRFFEMGFEAQVRSICNHIRPDRQTLLFSATFKKKIEQLARTVTDNPIKIIQKSLGEANEDITQHVIILPDASKKWDWLTRRLVEFTSTGSVLIFVTRIINSEELFKNLKEYGKETLLLHGDMEQSERNRVITAFKRKELDVMIATDVAARGLDINHIKTVINYDTARDIDTHIHRVGRTGRAGSKGDAYTLITTSDKDFAGHLVNNLESSNQEVRDDLMRLAMQSYNFRKSRAPKHKHHKKSSSHHSGGSSHSKHEDRPHSNYHSHNHHSHHHHRGSSHSSRSDRDRGHRSGPSSGSGDYNHEKRPRLH